MGNLPQEFAATRPVAPAHTVLVVDDQVQARVLLTRFLRRMGYRVETAENGLQAVEAVAARRPDIVLMDLEMPVMAGYEATERIRANAAGRWMPIVFLSATPDSAALIHALNSGADDYLIKPISYTVLRAKMRAVSRTLTLTQDLEERTAGLAAYRDAEEEQNRMAEHVMRRLAKNDLLEELALQHWISPAHVFSGDLIAAARTPAGTLHVMLADGAGHGLAAALSALTVTQPFYRMTEKGYSLGGIAAELNDKIRELLPVERFVAATLLSVDFKQQLIEIWNGGNPPLCVIGEDGALLHTGRSSHLPLGVANAQMFSGDPEIYHYRQACRVVASSDGLFEAAGWPTSEAGAQHLAGLLRAHPARSELDALKAHCTHLREGDEWRDDVSVCMVTCIPGEHSALNPAAPLAGHRAHAGDWHFQMRLSAEQLRTVDVVPLLHDLVGHNHAAFAGNPKLFLILAELLSNAIDHGVLGLDSSIKREPDGFQRYLQQRQEKLAALTEASIEVRIAAVDCDVPTLRIQVKDCGRGFDHEHVLELEHDFTSPYGRGIPLVRRACDGVEYRGCGNEVEVLFGLGGEVTGGGESATGLNAASREPLKRS
jgi:DNA-binding response OmpR family regulator